MRTTGTEGDPAPQNAGHAYDENLKPRRAQPLFARKPLRAECKRPLAQRSELIPAVPAPDNLAFCNSRNTNPSTASGSVSWSNARSVSVWVIFADQRTTTLSPAPEDIFDAEFNISKRSPNLMPKLDEFLHEE